MCEIFDRLNIKVKRCLKTIIGYCIQFIESIEYKGYDFDENDISKKIIKEYDVDDLLVNTDTGYKPISKLYVTQPYRLYEIRTFGGLSLDCADNHIVYLEDYKQIFVKDLKPNDKIITQNGCDTIKSIHKYPFKVTMRDIEVNSMEHRYFSNGILSHNTTTIAAFLSWLIVFHIDRNILIVANKETTAIEIVDKIINIIKGLPFWLKPGTSQWGKTSIKLDNGSRIISSATTNTASIGFTIHCVLLDEFAHVPENIVNNFWRSVYPTLSSSRVSQCIITSTPNGTTNKFYEVWSKALKGENSFIPIRTDYWEVPGHDDEWAKKQRADFGDEEFAQEFELQFNKDSKMILSANDARFTEKIAKKYVNKSILIQNQYLNNEFLTWHPDFDPNNVSENDKFIFIVDLAEGNGDPNDRFQTKKKTPDSNSINIFRLRLNSVANLRRFSSLSCAIKDCIRFEQVGKYECNSEDEVQAARVCSALAYNLFKDTTRNNVRVMVEMNFNGKSFFEEFKRHPLYSPATVLKTYHTKPVPGERQKKKYGFKTTQNKEFYCLKGNKMISQKRTIVTCVDTLEQMKSFGYVRGKLGGIAVHDDLSMPVFNHIPRMLDESSFIGWIEEYLYYNADKNKVYVLNAIIKQWALDNPEMTNDDFEALYGLNDNSLPMTNGTYYSNPYSEGYGGYGQQVSPYSSMGTYGSSPYSDNSYMPYSQIAGF